MTRSSKKRETIPPVMGKEPREQSRPAARLSSLIKQLLKESRFGGNRRKVATALSIDPSIPSKFNTDPLRDVDTPVINRLIDNFEPIAGHRLDPDFFYNESLGDNPDYRKFVRPKQSPRRRNPTPASTAPFPVSSVSTDADDMLKAMGATAQEKRLFEEHLKLFEYPFVSGAHVKAFLGGLRKGLSMLQATDQAVNASIDDEVARKDDRD